MRLIDADAFNHFDYSCFDGQLSEDAIQGMDTVLNVIDTAPTIDAEPVVHCKDCSRRDKNDRNWCDFFMCAISVETGFCYKGLRKERNDDQNRND